MDRAEIEFCARAAHEVNRAYCDMLAGGHDATQVAWEAAPDWQKQSCRNGVIAALKGATPADSHQAWIEEKLAAGWKWGPVKDPGKREHPCMVPYDQLPPEQQIKDALYLSTVRASSAAYGKRPQ